MLLLPMLFAPFHHVLHHFLHHDLVHHFQLFGVLVNCGDVLVGGIACDRFVIPPVEAIVFVVLLSVH